MSKRLLVAKYGTTSVTNGEGMDLNRLKAYAANLARVTSEFDLIVVSSGAMITGKYSLEQIKGQNVVAGDETLATIGSPHVVTAWQAALQQHGLLAGQILVTHRELEDKEESDKLEMTLRDSLGVGVVPIINENDALSDRELARIVYGGDNDGLASHIARRMEAQVLCIFTDVDGLLNGTRVVSVVPATPEDHAKAIGITTGAHGKNGARPSGMPYKVDAAIKAANAGIATYIANANANIEDVLAGETGTYFEPKRF
ncbi:MAG: hypothetical protein AAB624_01735 [Patescibacteria group bacterium]